jgi:hypothetical protein
MNSGLRKTGQVLVGVLLITAGVFFLLVLIGSLHKNPKYPVIAFIFAVWMLVEGIRSFVALKEAGRKIKIIVNPNLKLGLLIVAGSSAGLSLPLALALLPIGLCFYIFPNSLIVDKDGIKIQHKYLVWNYDRIPWSRINEVSLDNAANSSIGTDLVFKFVDRADSRFPLFGFRFRPLDNLDLLKKIGRIRGGVDIQIEA